jgi:4a-hydroxytetrahydrobiopterin dehydratase
MTDHISWRRFRESEGVEDWRNLSDGACAMFRTASFAESLRFVAAMGDLPGVDDHPPEVDIRHDGVTVQLLTVTETYDGMSQRDVDLARAISALARAEGITADPAAVQSLLVIPGAPAGAEVASFWRAAFGYETRPDDGMMDQQRRGPAVWVEPMQEAHPDGHGAMHLAIWVPYEVAEARVAAALAAGGRLVRDRAPAWWTLADAAGNEVDIATTMGRD